MPNRLSRREFLRVSALVTAGSIAAACAAPTEPTEPTVAPAEPTTAPEVPPAEAPSRFSEAPTLAEMVKAGDLPPVEERLPTDPVVLPVEEEIGQYGGNWRRVWLGPSDAYGMYRIIAETLLRWSQDSTQVIPNVGKSWEVSEDATEFTVHLREGMRWSDGAPFTADDVMFWYEDMQLNEDLTPVKHSRMMLGDEFGKIDKIDDYTIKFSYSRSYGLFEMQMASEFVPFAPKHYLQQFHPSYADPDKIASMTTEAGFEQWNQLFAAKNSWVNNQELPVLGAWVSAAEPTGTLWPADRNPYYWKVDEQGNQLPYVDRITHELITDRSLIPLKAVAGEIDMQNRHMGVGDLPLFMENRETGDYRVLMWPSTLGNSMVLMFNQNYDADPVVAEFIRTKEFRYALSTAIDRDELNEIVYLGLGVPRQSTLIPESPGYNPEWENFYADYDPDLAQQMLDDLGLEQKGSDGFRLRPDGDGPLTITISFTGDSDAQELIKSYWEAVGIKTALDNQERSVHYEKMHANELQVATWGNEEMIYPLLLVYPWWVMPYGTSSRIAPLSGLWFASGGTQGVEPEGDLLRVIELYREAMATPNEDERFEAAMEIMRLDAENLWTVGTVAVRESPVIVKNNFRNVPEKHLSGTVNLAPGNANPQTWFFKS